MMSSALAARRRRKTARPKSKLSRIATYTLLSIALGYGLLISFPQMLFAHEVSYKNFKVFSREPIDDNIYAVLDEAQAKLSTSAFKEEVRPQVFIADSFNTYTLFANVKNKSFGITNPLLPTSNNFINRSDVARNLAFRSSEKDNKRSLSGVIAHEATHLVIRKRFGYVQAFLMPSWKVEGYCEYVAGSQTLDFETGVKRWKENPNDDADYEYFKYLQMVKYLLDTEKASADELFTKDFNTEEIEAAVFKSLP